MWQIIIFYSSSPMISICKTVSIRKIVSLAFQKACHARRRSAIISLVIQQTLMVSCLSLSVLSASNACLRVCLARRRPQRDRTRPKPTINELELPNRQSAKAYYHAFRSLVDFGSLKREGTTLRAVLSVIVVFCLHCFRNFELFKYFLLEMRE